MSIDSDGIAFFVMEGKMDDSRVDLWLHASGTPSYPRTSALPPLATPSPLHAFSSGVPGSSAASLSWTTLSGPGQMGVKGPLPSTMGAEWNGPDVVPLRGPGTLTDPDQAMGTSAQAAPAPGDRPTGDRPRSWWPFSRRQRAAKEAPASLPKAPEPAAPPRRSVSEPRGVHPVQDRGPTGMMDEERLLDDGLDEALERLAAAAAERGPGADPLRVGRLPKTLVRDAKMRSAQAHRKRHQDWQTWLAVAPPEGGMPPGGHRRAWLGKLHFWGGRKRDADSPPADAAASSAPPPGRSAARVTMAAPPALRDDRQPSPGSPAEAEAPSEAGSLPILPSPPPASSRLLSSPALSTSAPSPPASRSQPGDGDEALAPPPVPLPPLPLPLQARPSGAPLADGAARSTPKPAAAVSVSSVGLQRPPPGVVPPLRRTRYPSAAQLEGLPLREGQNRVRFVARGSAQVSASIFLWGAADRIIVSDVDGTITRSDVRGQLFPAFGKDWSHRGVAALYTHLARSGYRFVYITSRSIGQAEGTRRFLQRVHQLPLDGAGPAHLGLVSLSDLSASLAPAPSPTPSGSPSPHAPLGAAGPGPEGRSSATPVPPLPPNPLALSPTPPAGLTGRGLETAALPTCYPTPPTATLARMSFLGRAIGPPPTPAPTPVCGEAVGRQRSPTPLREGAPSGPSLSPNATLPPAPPPIFAPPAAGPAGRPPSPQLPEAAPVARGSGGASASLSLSPASATVPSADPQSARRAKLLARSAVARVQARQRLRLREEAALHAALQKQLRPWHRALLKEARPHPQRPAQVASGSATATATTGGEPATSPSPPSPLSVPCSAPAEPRSVPLPPTPAGLPSFEEVPPRGAAGPTPAAATATDIPSGPFDRLPTGPVITSPDRLLASFTREVCPPTRPAGLPACRPRAVVIFLLMAVLMAVVIFLLMAVVIFLLMAVVILSTSGGGHGRARQVLLRHPEYFKIPCLRELLACFPDPGALAGGFGNRQTDFLSYRAVGVPAGKIFLINPTGHVWAANTSFGSLWDLNALADEIFPPVEQPQTRSSEVFNSFQYWSAPFRPVGSVGSVGACTARQERHRHQQRAACRGPALRRGAPPTQKKRTRRQ
ncbi:putative lipin family protein [Paratrimastix pyriformis]|uniref:Lipin family protein n=1 Tax=Paratrimastix pyriformis TaxID=342808 RepID=A0ABQ8U9K4_9EUKA|nr:putative lipin family protein [Paratrimastix pyriformis]